MAAAWSFHAGFKLLASFSGLRFLVDFAAVSNFVNHNDLLLVQRLVNYAVVSFSVLEKSRHVPLQGFWFDFVEMLRQPCDLFDDSLSDGRIELLELPARVLENAGIERANTSLSRRATVSKGSPRSPLETARFCRNNRLRTVRMVSAFAGLGLKAGRDR